MKLTKSQKKAEKAFKIFLNDPYKKCICLSGRPGTGKTFFIKEVIMKMVSKYYPLLTATTNKASVLLQGITIFRAMGISVTQTNDTSEYTLNLKNLKSLNDSLVIIDEASMLDKQMLDIILKHTPRCKIIFVGDMNQLPAVKCPANVFNTFPVVELTDVVRQKKADLLSCIEQAKDNISLVQAVLPAESPNVHIIRDDDELQKILKTFTKDDRLLSYTNAECVKYNCLFRVLNKLPGNFVEGDYAVSKSYCETPGKYNKSSFYATEETIIDAISEPHRVTFEGTQYDFFIRDVRFKNKASPFIMPENYEEYKKALNSIKNQAIAVQRAGTDPKNAKMLWRMYYFFKENMIDLRGITACTVHESQGSTYNRVIVNFDDIVHGSGITMNTKVRMLYVALSRAKEEIFIYTKRH